VTGTQGRRRKHILNEIERSHSVKNWLWKKLWTCRKTLQIELMTIRTLTHKFQGLAAVHS